MKSCQYCHKYLTKNDSVYTISHQQKSLIQTKSHYCSKKCLIIHLLNQEYTDPLITISNCSNKKNNEMDIC